MNTLTIKILGLAAVILGFGPDSLAQESEGAVAVDRSSVPTAGQAIYGSLGGDEDIETDIPFINVRHKIGIVELKPEMCYLVRSYEDEKKDALQLMFSCSKEFLKNCDYPNPSDGQLVDLATKIMELIDKYPDKKLSQSLSDYRESGGLIQINVEVITFNGFKDGVLSVGSNKNNSFAFDVYPGGMILKTDVYHEPMNEVISVPILEDRD